MRFSVVIPLHRVTPEFERALAALGSLDHDDYEVVIVTDQPVALPVDVRCRFVVTGSPVDTSPAEKRDAALASVTGDVIAYLDDDAYPPPDWLQIAEEAFADPGIGAIGGPGVTPPGSGTRERAGGAVYESPLGSGPLAYRFTPRAKRVVNDYPAYNLFVRTAAVRAINGWGSTFYGGEDTVFCRRLAEAGVLVHYEPQLVVFHHRRAVFGPHMRQVHNVGRHRGNFMRFGDPSSRSPMFVVAPAVVVVSIAWIVRAVFGRSHRHRLLLGAAAVAVAAACPDPAPRLRAVFPLALLAHHVAYTWGLITGFLSREMTR